VARFDQVIDVSDAIVLWRSRTLKRRRNITASTSRKRHGKSWECIRRKIEKRLRPRALLLAKAGRRAENGEVDSGEHEVLASLRMTILCQANCAINKL
jgi:hypothetical protein